MNKGEYQNFTYNGTVQTFVVPNTGIYKLEVWGGSGGYGWSSDKSLSPKRGGYAKGYKKLKKGTTLYICCGGNGGMTTDHGTIGGAGYNGGGGGWYGHMYSSSGNWGYVGPGGGATHIALVDGILSSIGKTTFDEYGLIVAGGGAGSGHYRSNGGDHYITGGNQGGNQSASGSFGQGANASGSCGNGGTWASGSGGGGYLGGTATIGGSSWIDGVDDYKEETKSMVQGGNTDGTAGRATITLMQKSSVKLGSLDCEVFLGDKQIEEIKLGTKDIG